MTNLERVTAKIFAGNAPINTIGQFGSALNGSKLNTSDVTQIQALPAYENGWASAVISERNYPTLEEMNGVLNVMSYQTAYSLQKGLPEWDSGTMYYETDVCRVGKIWYSSLQNENIGNNPTTSPNFWEKTSFGSSGTFLGQTITSTIPLNEDSLHLMDGALLSGDGIYSSFVEYISSLVNSNPEIFTTETDWQESVSQYGVCGKYVYDSTNNTLRIPKVTGFIEGTINQSELGDLVQAGLPNIEGQINNLRAGFGLPTATGAFSSSQSLGNQQGGASVDQWNTYLIDIDGSNSNSIYGNSTTVQPQSIKVYYYLVVGTSAKSEAEINFDNIAVDLNSKADIDLSNSNPSQNFIEQSVNWGVPDFSAGVAVSSNTFVAPADGIVLLLNGLPNNNEVATVKNERNSNNNSAGFIAYGYMGGSSHYGIVEKGETYTISKGSLWSVTFYPFKGVI